MSATELDNLDHLNHFGSCPECGTNWCAGRIFDGLRPQKWCADKSAEELKAWIVENYSPPYSFSRLIGIEIQGRYDGVWEYACPDCNARFPRFKEVQHDGKVQAH